MTRQEFIDSVNSFYDLIDFCNDYGCDICEDIVDDDTMDDYINEEIGDFYGSWRELRDLLSDIPTGYEYYRRDGRLDYVWMDNNDFESYKDDVLSWADDAEVFETEEEDEDDDGENESVEIYHREDNYYFTDPITGEVFEAGHEFAMASKAELSEMLF